MPRGLCALSPERTTMVTVTTGFQFCRVTNTNAEDLCKGWYPDSDAGGEVYDITFDSETRFYLKVDGQDQRFKVPYNIKPRARLRSTSDKYPLSIIKEQPEPLSEPRVTQPYTLDANCEWVLDAKSRKICWIPPGNVRRGDGGHFWIGTALVMFGDDGVVRKVTFKEPGH